MEDVEAQDVAEGKAAEEEGVAAKKTRKVEDATARLGEVQQLLVEIDADSGPSRAAELLAGLGFSASDQVSFSGLNGAGKGADGELVGYAYAGFLWRMEDAIVARTRFVPSPRFPCSSLTLFVLSTLLQARSPSS